MRRILAITLTTTAAVSATGAAAWTMQDRATAQSCEQTDHGTPADAARSVSGLTPGTQAALAAAQKAATRAGMALTVNSGYRSPAYQQRVYECWVEQTGSTQAAREHALPPAESAHVAGYAIDVAPPEAAAWLEHTAGRYGLCRRYGNEAWHFEYQAAYSAQGCPALVEHP